MTKLTDPKGKDKEEAISLERRAFQEHIRKTEELLITVSANILRYKAEIKKNS